MPVRNTLTASPNPAPALYYGGGRTTLSWHAPGYSEVEVRVDAPDGPLLARSGPTGSADTGDWVRDGMTFFLQSAADTGTSRTLAQVTVSVTVRPRPARTYDDNAPRIFCVSMQRSGTTSVGRFFRDVGFDWAGWPADEENDWSQAWYEGRFEDIFASADFRAANAFEDSPWWLPDFYKVLFHRFPAARFVLLTRDPDAWFQSMLSHSGGAAIGGSEFHCKVYRREREYFDLLSSGAFDPEVENRTHGPKVIQMVGKADHYTELYRLHTREVRTFFDRFGPDRLFTTALDDPDKWVKLAAFLGVHIPEGYDAHENATQRGQSSQRLLKPGTRARSAADRFCIWLYDRLVRRDGHGSVRGLRFVFQLRAQFRRLTKAALPIRIVFLAQDPQDWFSLQSVYDACVADPRFEVHVVNTGFRDDANGFRTDCAELFDRIGVPYHDATADAIDLAQFSPDLVAVSSPYDDYRLARYRSDLLSRVAHIVYVPYCIDYSDRAGESTERTFGSPTHRHAWRIFTRSARTLPGYGRFGIEAARVVPLGHPRIDRFGSPDSGLERLPERILRGGDGRFRIVYAPHHSVRGWSTFERFGAAMRGYLDAHPDCYIVFRPHPYLVKSLVAAGATTEAEFRALFDGERCCLYEGIDYHSLFRWADLLVSDASSFLVEFAPTRKPIVYTYREDGRQGLDDTLADDVAASCYTVSTVESLVERVDALRRGDDPLASVRPEAQERMNVGMFTGGAGARIAHYIRDALS